MSVTAVIGSQWGDEGKGKFVDFLSQDADIVARFNGGDNAGHTVVNEYGTTKLRLTPNGLFNPQTNCVIGPGVVVNLETLVGEVEIFQNLGLDFKDRLWISPRCHLVMPYHPLIEEIFEKARGRTSIGTTKRGMGPVFADKVSYNGIRLWDLMDEALFSEKLRVQLSIKNTIFQAFGMPSLDFNSVKQEKLEQFNRVRQFVREPFGIIQKSLVEGGDILLEGAQGALLDNNWGTYPYCTASITLAGGAAAGLGIAPHRIQRIVAVAKAYTTRVGAGPMPSELFDRIGETLQEEGKEFGTVTGRPRRCGWFDAELVSFTTQLNGATELALSKLDVLDKLPMIRICTGYRMESTGARLWHYWEGDAQWLESSEPVYIEMEGWEQSTRKVRSFNQLPRQAQSYVRKVEELVGVPIEWVSVGPDRQETFRI